MSEQEAVHFSSLRITNWRQFHQVKLDFHPRLTVLTGANGAGKTSILNLLNRHWGWNIQLVSSPRKTKKGKWLFWSGFWSEKEEDEFDDLDDEKYEKTSSERRVVGDILLSDGTREEISAPEQTEAVFSLLIEPTTSIPGVFVPSHRPVYVHQPVTEIPTQLDARDQIYETYVTEIRNRFVANARVKSPSHKLKSSLISLATFGYGNRAVSSNDDAVSVFEGFEKVLKTVLPKSLGFEALLIKVPEVFLKTSTGPIALDSVSGGIAAIIDLAWQIQLYSTIHGSFTVVIDEPETHLHPQLQRTILPDLLDAFPGARFIVATHNPLVIGSVPDSKIYVLDYQNEKVVSHELSGFDRSGTANELLRNALGLSTTMPRWVEETLVKISAKMGAEGLSETTVVELRNELRQLGLEQYSSDVLIDLVKKRS